MRGPLEERAKVWEYETVLEKIGYGKTQWILLLVSGLLTITTVAAQQAMGIVVIASQCDFHTTQAEKGVMMATRTAGLVLSTIIWGYISDDIGRRKALLYGTFISNVLDFSLIFVSDLWLFNFINFFGGICVGSVPAALYPYLGEFNIPRHRAVTINYSTMFVTVSAIIVPGFAWLILSYDWAITFGDFIFRPWRLMLLINLIPGLIGCLVLYYFPESPKFLLSQDKTGEAIEVVAWISKFNRGKPIQQVLDCDEFTLKSEDPDEERVLSYSRGGGILTKIVRAHTPLFHKPHRLNFVLCNLAVFGLFFSSCGVQIWLPDIVNKLSGDGNNSSTVCEILSVPIGALKNSTQEDCTVHISSKTYIDNLIVGFAFLFGFSIQGFLLNPLGRKNVLNAALAGAVLSGIFLHFTGNPTGVLVLFCLYILLPGLCISIMIGAIVDLVPTHLRSKAVSFCLSMGRLGVIASTNLIGVMLQPYCNTTFAIFTCTLIACFVIVHYLPIKNSA